MGCKFWQKLEPRSAASYLLPIGRGGDREGPFHRATGKRRAGRGPVDGVSDYLSRGQVLPSRDVEPRPEGHTQNHVPAVAVVGAPNRIRIPFGR